MQWYAMQVESWQSIFILNQRIEIQHYIMMIGTICYMGSYLWGCFLWPEKSYSSEDCFRPQQNIFIIITPKKYPHDVIHAIFDPANSTGRRSNFWEIGTSFYQHTQNVRNYSVRSHSDQLFFVMSSSEHGCSCCQQSLQSQAFMNS